MTETARLRELLAEADDYRTLGRPEVERSEAAVMHAIAAALPSLLDRLEAAEAVVEAAREVDRRRQDHGRDADAETAMHDALRRYDEVSRG